MNSLEAGRTDADEFSIRDVLTVGGRRISRAVRIAPRWLLLGALLYAPWDYGATTERGIVTLNRILGVAVLLWGISKLWNANSGRRDVAGGNESEVRRRRFAIRNLPWLLIALLLLLGWYMALNARTIYDSEHYLFSAIDPLLPALSGSVDRTLTSAAMVRVTVLLGVIALVADLSRSSRWLLRLWWTVGLAGGSIALLGLIQKASGARMIFWGNPDEGPLTFFATYYYHANAGAFLNVTLSLTIGLAARAFHRRGQPLLRALWVSLALISVVAAFANTSRMSHIVAAVIGLVLAAAFVPAVRRRIRHVELGTAVAGLLAAAIALYVVVQSSRVDRAVSRWQAISEAVPRDARWAAAQAALRAAPDAGWLGFGPGTFHVVFPYYTGTLEQRLGGVWIYLHQDYLQTVLEWGWLGSALWGALFFGGMFVAMRSLLRQRARVPREVAGDDEERASELRAHWEPRRRLLLPLVLLGLASVALHAAVDFPLQIASIQLYAATYLGICWGSPRWRAGTPQPVTA